MQTWNKGLRMELMTMCNKYSTQLSAGKESTRIPSVWWAPRHRFLTRAYFCASYSGLAGNGPRASARTAASRGTVEGYAGRISPVVWGSETPGLDGGAHKHSTDWHRTILLLHEIESKQGTKKKGNKITWQNTILVPTRACRTSR